MKCMAAPFSRLYTGAPCHVHDTWTMFALDFKTKWRMLRLNIAGPSHTLQESSFNFYSGYLQTA